MVNKKFTSLQTYDVVEVKRIDGDIAHLDNGDRVSLSRLQDRNYYDEYIDPLKFFNNESLLNDFTQKIRQIPEDIISRLDDSESGIRSGSIVNISDNEPAILPYDPEEEKAELLRKYSRGNNLEASINKQNEAFRNLISEEDQVQENIIPIMATQQVDTDFTQQHEVTVNIPRRDIVENHTSETYAVKEDPITQMFKNTKRNVNFGFSITIDEKIPRVDFIEMLEDSYNTSIIDFLAEEFTRKILSNPDEIRNTIKNELRKIVYGVNDGKSESKDTVVKRQPISKTKPSSRRVSPKLDTDKKTQSNNDRPTINQ